jgi:multiple sugar transport system permease protein
MAIVAAHPKPHKIFNSGAKKKKGKRVTGLGSSGLIFITPTLILLATFFLVPLLGVAYLSVTQWSLVGSPQFVGLQNYQGLFSNTQFWSAVSVTGKISLYMAIPGALFAFVLAIMINEGKHTNFFSTIILFPLVFPSVVSVFIWEAMFKGDGILNSALGVQINWLSSTNWALPSLALMMLWTNLGYYTIIALAGVKDVPAELFDAASIDGAGYLKRIRWITLPLMRPILLFILMIATSDALTLFIQPYLLTQGGPGDATRTLSQLIYQTAFMYTDVGKASAIAVILLIAALIVAGFQFRFFNRGKES